MTLVRASTTLAWYTRDVWSFIRYASCVSAHRIDLCTPEGMSSSLRDFQSYQVHFYYYYVSIEFVDTDAVKQSMLWFVSDTGLPFKVYGMLLLDFKWSIYTHNIPREQGLVTEYFCVCFWSLSGRVSFRKGKELCSTGELNSLKDPISVQRLVVQFLFASFLT